MLLQNPRLQVAVFALLALVPLSAPLADLDNFTSIAVQYFYADSQIPDLVGFLSEPMEPGWYAELLTFQDGSTCLSGMSVLWNLWLLPFFKVFGFTARAMGIACIFSHGVFAVALWFLARQCFPRRDPLVFALVFFCTPWYWASIFSNTFLSPTMALSLLGLMLLCRAMLKDRPLPFVWAGLVLGVCLYGYLVHRVYSVVALGLVWVHVALAWRRWKELGKTRLISAAVFSVAFVAVLHANLADPGHVAHAMFHDREMMLGEQYWEDVEQAGAVRTALGNLVGFFTENEYRLQSLALNIVQALLFFVGVVLVVRRRHVPGAVLIICGGAVYGAGSIFSNAWTWTRMGTMTIPFLAICALGLDHLLGWVGGRKPWARWVVVAAFAGVSATAAVYFWDHPLNRPAPIFEVARAVVAKGGRLEVVLHTGDDDKAHRERYFVKLALTEADRHEEARCLRFFEFLDAKTMDQQLEELPKRSVLLVRHLKDKAVMPTVPVKAWKTFGKHYTVYYYSGDARPKPRPQEGEPEGERGEEQPGEEQPGEEKPE